MTRTDLENFVTKGGSSVAEEVVREGGLAFSVILNQTKLPIDRQIKPALVWHRCILNPRQFKR